MKFSILKKQFFEYVHGTFNWALLVLIWTPMTFLFGLGGLLALASGDVSLGIDYLAIFLSPIPLLILAYFADRGSKSMVVRGMIVYFFWFMIILTEILIFQMMIGGMSMAVNEGVAGSFKERMADYLIDSVRGILFAQPIIVGLTVAGVYQLKKKIKRQ